MTKVLIITGATATGKTKLAIAIAKQLGGELVSADSRQIYKGLDIISGKDIHPGDIPIHQKSVSFRGRQYPLVTYQIEGIPVWLYDAVSPDQPCSISLYRSLANAAIADIVSRGKLPIIVGGAGLYIQAVTDTPETIDVPMDNVARRRWDTLTAEALQSELSSVDRARLSRMNNSDRNNPRRLIRALEVAQWIEQHKGLGKKEKEFDELWIGLRNTVSDMEHGIRERVRSRWKNGAVDEVKKLGDIASHLPAVSTLGIAAITDYIRTIKTEDEARDTWAKQEIAYAKRQMVWFKKNKNIRWFESNQDGLAALVVKDVREWYT